MRAAASTVPVCGRVGVAATSSKCHDASQPVKEIQMLIACVSITIALGLAVYMLRRSFIANIALTLLSISLCLTVLEAYFRFFYIKSDGFARLARNFAARYYRFDNYGLRASNLPLSKARDNIVILGDSFVFGAGLKHPAERFSAKLAAHYPQYHLVNIGLPGWDTKTEIEQASKYLGDSHAAIPLVVLAYFFNDIEEDTTVADRSRLVQPIAPAKETVLDRTLQRLSDYSRLVEFVYFRIGYPRLVSDRLTQIQMFYSDPQVMERHLASLERLRSLLTERYHARLLIVVLPFLHSDELLNKTAFYRPFENVLDEHGFSYVDMQSVFAKYGVAKLRVDRFDPHTNAFANALIAQSIIEYLNLHPDALRPPRGASQP